MQTEVVTKKTLHKVLLDIKQELHELKEIFLCKELTEEDREFIEGTRQGWKEIDEGKGRTRSREEFLKELESWN